MLQMVVDLPGCGVEWCCVVTCPPYLPYLPYLPFLPFLPFLPYPPYLPLLPFQPPPATRHLQT
jgi:hypothetical protein